MKICFVALNSYPVLSQEYGVEKIGGAEVQQVYIARGLRDKGYNVSFITQDYGQADEENIDGMFVYKTFREKSGIPVLRFIYPRLVKIWQALDRADADIYYVRTAGFLAGAVAFFCNRFQKKFIYAAASDTDFIPDKLIVSTSRDKFLYKYGLKYADKIIVQSNRQKQLLKQNFGQRGILIQNFSHEKSKQIKTAEKNNVLWVSTIRDLKRPHYFITLSEQFPEEKFVMIGGPDDFEQELYKEIKERCKQIHNLDFLGFQPLNETEKYFDKAKVFVNTSVHEGFPNTFLQAWRRGIPVISFVDPDNIIKENDLGFIADNVDELSDRFKEFLASSSYNSVAIIDYYRQNHSVAVIDQYCGLFEELLS